MKKTILFGPGKWGSVLRREIIKLTNLVETFDSKSDIYNFNFSDIDWAFVSTSNESHFKIVDILLDNNINIFCEKPLTLSSKDSEYLITKARNKNLKLFINHIYDFKNVNIDIIENNKIYRSKNSKKSFIQILYDLSYHDIYLLSSYITLAEAEILDLQFQNDILTFLINFRLRSFFFKYNCNKEQEHYINDTNLIDNINILPDILMRLFNNEIDLSINNQKAVECNIFIERLIEFSNKS